MWDMWLVVQWPSGEVELSKKAFTTSLCHIGLANQATILSQTCTNTKSVLSSRHTQGDLCGICGW